jgi:Outer membrane protein beta-barrel domain
MKRSLALLLLFLGVGAPMAHAGEISIGAGAFGGYAVPIIQDDAGSGVMYGVRVPVQLSPMFTIEPYFMSSQLDDVTEELGDPPVEYTRSGFEMMSIGGNVILFNGTFYPFVGFGSYELTRPGSEDISELGWNFGLGLGLPVAEKFRLDIRGELDMIVTDESSRKFGAATVGLTYHLSKE